MPNPNGEREKSNMLGAGEIEHRFADHESIALRRAIRRSKNIFNKQNNHYDFRLAAESLSHFIYCFEEGFLLTFQ